MSRSWRKRGRGGRKKVPVVLQKIFGTRLKPIGVLLAQDLAGSVGQEAELKERLRSTPDDPHGFEEMLRTCLAVVCTNAPELPVDLRLEECSEPMDVIARAILASFRNSAAPRSVLCQGFRMQSTGRSKSFEGHGDAIVEQVVPNALVDVLLSPQWKALLQRIGDRLMVHLLTHCLVFVRCNRPRGNYLQLCGGQISGAARMKGRDAMENPVVATPDKKPVVKPHARHPMLEIMDCKPASQDSMVADSEGEDDECYSSAPIRSSSGVSVHTKRTRRPSSWLRRKHRKLVQGNRAELAAHTENNAENVTCTNTRQGTDHRSPQHIEADMKGKQPRDTSRASSALSRKAPQKWKPATNVLIPRFGIFYSKLLGQKPGLPEVHVLNRLSESKTSARKLYKDIFMRSLEVGPRTRGKEKRQSARSRKFDEPRFVPKKHHELLGLLEKVLHRGKNCPFSLLLEHHCPLPIQVARSGVSSLSLRSSSSLKSPPYQSLIAQHVEHSKVADFVWSVCQNTFPKNLFGDKHNRLMLQRTIKLFVSMRRYETLSLHYAFSGLKTGAVPWLHGEKKCKQAALESEHAAKVRMLQRLVHWLLSEFVVSLIRANFYVTESQAHRLHVFYYRKPVWKQIQHMAVHNFTRSVYQRVTRKEAAEILCARRVGFSTLRMIPKASGMRMVANFSTPSMATFRSGSGRRDKPSKGGSYTLRFAPINHVIQGLFLALKQECRLNPQVLGSSVFGYNDAYSKLQPYLRRLKASASNLQRPLAYIIGADISQAFDTINVKKLLEVVTPLFTKEEYRFLQVSSIAPGTGRLSITQRTLPALPESKEELNAILSDIGGRRKGIVFTHLSHQSVVTRNTAVKHLHDALCHSLLRIGRGYYRQKVGIGQGMVASALLCSLYYAEMERVYIQPMFDSSDDFDDLLLLLDEIETPSRKANGIQQPLLLRLIDDVLFIAPSKSMAERFLKRLKEGFPDFGVRIHPGKTKHNCGWLSDSGNEYVDGMGVRFVSWCGLLINSANLEIQADYTRYRGDGIASTLTIPLTKRPGKMLATKLCSYMRPKCHAILFDRAINSPTTIRLNVYQLFMLSAMKFHCHVSRMPKPPNKCESMLVDTILLAIEYTFSLMNSRMGTSTTAKGSGTPVSYCHVKWLGLTAFLKMLSRRAKEYEPVLRALKKMLSASVFRLIAKQLRNVVDDRRSSVFWQIEF
eukprot:scaffold2044_cov305-Pavlova_lutheri.AAC.24